MRFFSFVFFTGIVFFSIRGCMGCGDEPFPHSNGAPQQTAAAPVPQTEKVPVEEATYSNLHLTDLDGGEHEVTLDPQTSVIYMATWCPHSQALKQMLNDPSMQPYEKSHKLIFVFGRHEWRQFNRELQDAVKQGVYTKDQAAEITQKVRKRAHGSIFFDPSFFDDLPGDAYIGDIPSLTHGFPSARVQDRFAAASTWMQADLQMPTSAVIDLFDHYDASKDSTDHGEAK
jgi:hypothetical protein